MQSKSLHLVERGPVKAVQCDQQLLVCNGYPGKAPMSMRKNEKDLVLADAGADAGADAVTVAQGEPNLTIRQPEPAPPRGIDFGECRYVASRVLPADRLELMLGGTGVHGTFEVGELPQTDAILLLIVSQADPPSDGVTESGGSAGLAAGRMSFQSFAFPTTAGGTEAQLAVIDTYRGNSTTPHLKMEDHMTGKEQQTVSKRIEKLRFNRVYAIEEGTYDASVTDRFGGLIADELLERRSKRVLRLARNRNYVILRTGDEVHYPQSLVVFPQVRSGSSRVTPLSIVAATFAVLGMMLA